MGDEKSEAAVNIKGSQSNSMEFVGMGGEGREEEGCDTDHREYVTARRRSRGLRLDSATTHSEKPLDFLGSAPPT